MYYKKYFSFSFSTKTWSAWKRLETGTFTQDDVTWIKHECAERHHELNYDSGYTEAHERAQSRYDGYPWDKSRIRTSKEEVLEQVLSGLESVNQSLGTNYKLSKIYFSPFDISTNRIYSGLIAALIRHYHSGNEFV